MAKNISDVIKDIGDKAEAFLGKKYLFKAKLYPIFDEIREFEEKILEHIGGMPKITNRRSPPKLRKYSKKAPEEGYIWVSNSRGGTSHFTIYYPTERYGHFVGWVPKSLFENDPLSTLFSLAWACPQPQDIDLLAYQYAIVAIMHDVPRIGQSCQTLYFDSSGNDIASRAALDFERLVLICAQNPITPPSRTITTRIIARLYNALKSVELDLGKVTGVKQEDDDRLAIKGNDNGTVLPSIDTEGWWSCKNLTKLRDIDSNSKRDGIKGTKKHLKDLKAYLRNKRRDDIAKTLEWKKGRIKTTIPYRKMFLQN